MKPVQTVRVSVWWRPMTRREREVMLRVLENRAAELTRKWDKEDGAE